MPEDLANIGDVESSDSSLVLDKTQLLDLIKGLQLFASEYGDLVEGANGSENLDEEALSRILVHREQIASDANPLRHLGVLFGLLHHLLERSGQTRIHFRVPSSLITPTGPEPNDLLAFVRALGESTRAVDSMITEIKGIAERHVAQDSGPLYPVLIGIASLYKAILRQDWDDVSMAISYLNLATSPREQRDLVDQIAKMARDIFDSLNAFSADLPLEKLYLTTEEIPDTMGNLELVIEHLAEAANANLDSLERLERENRETLEWIGEAEAAANEAREHFDMLIAENPELESALREALATLESETMEQIANLDAQYRENNKAIMAMTANQGFQDLTGQTLRKVIRFMETLQFQLVELLQHYMEDTSLLHLQDSASDKSEQPSPESAVQSQEDIDKLLTNLGF